MTGAERYVKIVEWSDEDGVFVGQCPGIIGPCCHGEDEVEVYRELCQIVAEWGELAQRDGTSLPPPTAGIGLAEKIQQWLSTSSPTPETRKAAQLAAAGAFEDDPDLVGIVEEVYRRRGRPITEDGSFDLLHGLGSGSPRSLDEQIAAEPKLAPLDLTSDATASSVETHLGQFRRRLLAVAGIVENGVVRPLDPAVKLPEHARVIIVGSEDSRASRDAGRLGG